MPSPDPSVPAARDEQAIDPRPRGARPSMRELLASCDAASVLSTPPVAYDAEPPADSDRDEQEPPRRDAA